MTNVRPQNPFAVQTPEHINAEDTFSLFVNVFSDFKKIPHQGHTFINGPRGSGKSMMFRYMRPDCQMLEKKENLRGLDYFGIYIPIKATTLPITDLSYLKNQHANAILTEHLMTAFFASKTFSAIGELKISNCSEADLLALTDFAEKHFLKLLKQCGWLGEMSQPTGRSVASLIGCLEATCDSIYGEGLNYLRRMSLTSSPPEYQGPLCSYFEFLFPLLSAIRELPFMPQAPLYLLVDDADNLNITQTMILNSWVATRTTGVVSFKISTQLHYKTYRTISNQTIDEPHDFTAVDISTVYTSSKNKYKQRVKEIVKKRLALAGIEAEPEEFFPSDLAQDAAIKKIEQQYKEKWATEGRGNRARDDALRYARPDYMAGLKGRSKSMPSYSYSGFDQLIHISSGIVRHFLEPAAQMYDRQAANHQDSFITSIEPSVQNAIVRQESEELMLGQFQRLAQQTGANGDYDLRIRKLYNLISSLGGTFHQILLTPNKSERRVFSIFVSDGPDDEVLSVLTLGVDQGFFHLSTIGNKEGTGRIPLYVLTRRLAPYFNLDPSGFAGYLSVKNSYLTLAMTNPKHVRNIKEQGVDEYFNDGQMALFD